MMVKIALSFLCVVGLLTSSTQAITTTNTANIRGTTDTDDTSLLESSPTRQLGGVDVLWSFGSDSEPRKSLLRFDLAALARAQVLSATLRLAHNTDGLGSPSFSDRKTELFKISQQNAGWVEGGFAIQSPPGLATWNSKSQDITQWAGSPGLNSPGTDYDLVPLGSFTSSKSDPDGTFYEVSFSDLSFLQEWIDDPSTNAGLLLQSEQPVSGQGIFSVYSSEAENVAYQPLLTIEFIIPEPSTHVLLALGILTIVGRRRGKQEDCKVRKTAKDAVTV